MTCGDFQIQIDDAIDGTLSTDAQAALEAHLATCPACRGAQADLRLIRSTARALDSLTPPGSSWPRIAAALEAQRVRRAGAAQRTRLVLATAAIAVVMAAGSWTAWQRLSHRSLPSSVAQQQRAASTAKAAASAESEIQQAEEHYNKAIASLEQITRSDPAALDAQTTAELQQNLGVIDTAIGESQEALHADPSNDVARQSLFDALRSKVTLLEDTVALINEMRKGNQEGAARILSGMKP